MTSHNNAIISESLEYAYLRNERYAITPIIGKISGYLRLVLVHVVEGI